MPPVSDQDYRILESSPCGFAAPGSISEPGPPSTRPARRRRMRARALPRSRPPRAISASPAASRTKSPAIGGGRLTVAAARARASRGRARAARSLVPRRAELAEQRVVGAALELAGRLPGVEEDDALGARLAQLLEAAEAGAQRRVAVRALERVAEPGGLQDRVLLGVHADADVVGRAARVLLAVGAAVAALLARRCSAGSRAACRCSRSRRCGPRARARRRRGVRCTPRAGASRPR